MARIRTVKPEFWSSPDTAKVDDPWARLLFIAMWNWADDAGRGTANPKELAGFAFPNDESISPADVRRMLGGIRRGFGVKFYKIGGRTYYAIPSWDRHQKVDHRSGARYPAPDSGEEWVPDLDPPPDQHKLTDSASPTEVSVESPEPPSTARRGLGAGTGEQGNRGTGEQGNSNDDADASSSSATAKPPRDDVDQLCARLRDRIIGNGFAPPTITADWRRQARLLLDKDDRDLTQALRLIDWATADEFWHPNIKSMGKFRAQYDTLLARARQQQHRTNASGSKMSTTDQRVADIQALKHAPQVTPPSLRLLGGAS